MQAQLGLVMLPAEASTRWHWAGYLALPGAYSPERPYAMTSLFTDYTTYG